MDTPEVKAIVERESGLMMHRLGIDHWTIKVIYHPQPASPEGYIAKGECSRLLDYHSAHITLNPTAFDDEAEVLGTLLHELFHVVLSPFDLYSEGVDRLGLSTSSQGVLDRVWSHACERAISSLERMYHGLTS